MSGSSKDITMDISVQLSLVIHLMSHYMSDINSVTVINKINTIITSI